MLRKIQLAACLSLFGVLTACGGGGGGGGGLASLSIGGVAATGAAIQSGTVSAKCARGTATTTTNADGTYTLTISDGVLPCILKANEPITNTDYYSVAEVGATTANITPLTHLVAANTLSDAPSNAFSNFDSLAQAKITSAKISTAMTNIQAATASLGADADMTGIDLLKTNFKPAVGSASGDATDQKIDALMTALAAANKRITDLENQLKSVASTNAASTNLLNTLGSAVDKLPSCPYARSTKVWVMDMLGSSPIQYAVDFAAMTLTQVSNNQVSPILAKTDGSNNPIKCAFTSTINGSSVEYRVARGGNIVWTKANDFGLAVPSQSAWGLSDAQAVGTYPTMTYVTRKDNHNIRGAFPMKIVIKPDGSVDGYTCDLSKSAPDCTNVVEDSAEKNTCTKLQSGAFTCTSTSGTTSVGILYVNGGQATLYLAITDMVSNGFHWGGLAVATKAVDLRLPKVGEISAAGAAWFAGIDPSSLTLSSGATSAATVDSVDAGNNSFITSTSGTAQTIQRYINVPTPGMSYSVLSNAKAVTLVGNGGWSLAITKLNSSTLWDGWYAYIAAP